MTKNAIIICPGYKTLEIEQQALAPFDYKVQFLQWHDDFDKLREGLKDADLVFVRDVKLDKQTIDNMQHCQAIIRYGVGYDNIDIQAANDKGIIVARVPDYGAEIEVADHALSMLLAAKRKILSRDRQVRQGQWFVAEQEPITRIAGATLGLLGYGKIAQAVEFRLRAFGIKHVIAYDPFLQPNQLSSPSAELVSLQRLANESDFLSLHAPVSEQNKHIINKDFLNSMRNDAIIVNTARGGLINEHDLYQHLTKHKQFFACLDVFEMEPPPKDNPLFSLANTLFSDHCGWYSESTVEAMQTKAAQQAVEIVKTGKASNQIII